METQITLEMLFEQLGLDTSEKGMDVFVDEHQLDKHIPLLDAVFWNETQRNFLQLNMQSNNDWSLMIEILNELLHGS